VRLKRWAEAVPNAALAPLAAAAIAGGIAEARPPDLVIGAGRRGNLAAFARARRGARAVAVLDPHLPFARFAAVILPEHDRRGGPGVIETLGAMNRLTPQAIAAAARPFPDLPAPRLAVLIGGPSRSAGFGAVGLEALLADLRRFEGWSLLATPSRRTPPLVVEALRENLPGMWLWDGAGQNPYPGLLAAADAVLVTADSVNMASEAAATGKPVFVSGTPRPGSKHARFHAALRARGISRPAAEGPAEWRYTPLAEADRVAGRLAARLGFHPGGTGPI